MTIGVLGCMAQKDQELIRKRAPHVDIVVGTGQLARLPELIELAKEHGDAADGRQPRADRRDVATRSRRASRATTRSATRRCGRPRSRRSSAS